MAWGWKILALVGLLGQACAAPLTDLTFNSKVQPEVAKTIVAEGKTDVFVKMSNDLNILELVNKRRFLSRSERTKFVYESMNARMMENHSGIHAFLAEEGDHFHSAKSFWITNAVFIEGVDKSLLIDLSMRSDVVGIYPDEIHPLQTPEVEDTEIPQVNGVEWGVERIQAPSVWATGNTGEGIVVANIDTGVRHTHEALKNNYRGTKSAGVYDHNYNYFDGRGGSPSDSNGHGTHTMGTIAGSNGIGVAPGAKWIAAVGCRTLGCSTKDLSASAEWMVCPTNLAGTAPDCSKAPHVINNSWGGGQNDLWYYSYVEAWHAAGIIPVFALGNSGPNCGTANSPGDYDNVLAVGASNINNQISSFSSRGPSKAGLVKPDIAAPGENVRSAMPNSDVAYQSMSGTSMAAPHVAGAMALLLAEKDMIFEDAMTIMTHTAATSGLKADKVCGGVSTDTYPNNSWGYGLLSTCVANKAAGGSCSSEVISA